MASTDDAAAGYAPKSKIRNADTLSAGRATIVDVALEAFARDGFHDTSVEDIAADAGLTVGGLYKYVRSKHDILFLVLERQTEEMTSALANWVTADVDPVSALRNAYADYVGLCDRWHKVVIVGYRETYLLASDARDHILRFENDLRQQFRTLLDRAASHDVADRERLLTLAADDAVVSGHMWAVNQRVYGEYLDLDDYIELKTRLMMESLRCLAPPPSSVTEETE
jgi:AcrR family transcriptional regulator